MKGPTQEESKAYGRKGGLSRSPLKLAAARVRGKRMRIHDEFEDVKDKNVRFRLRQKKRKEGRENADSSS